MGFVLNSKMMQISLTEDGALTLKKQGGSQDFLK